MTISSLTAFRVGLRYVAIRLSVTAAPADTTPCLLGGGAATPMHLAILLDTSGSMDGHRIDAVKRTLHAARDLFKPTDRLTLICFDDEATTMCRCLAMTETGKERFYERVDSITPQGCTNLSAGIEKLLWVQEDEWPYTGLVMLTDGHINRGITSAVGLREMVAGLRAGPVTALGYGAEHNRTLLRDLAIHSRGAYTFIDSDETLPVVIGDLMYGQHFRVLQEAVVTIDGQPNWISAELDGDGARHVVGDIVPDRDYWIVFENADLPAAHPLSVTLTAATGLIEGSQVTLEIPEEAADPTGTATIQVLRCRVAAISAAVTNALESGQRPEDAYRVRLTVIREELASASASASDAYPLVLRLRTQVAELLDAIEHAPTPNAWSGTGTPTVVLARLASNTAQLSLQRGVATASIGDPIQPAAMFSSPLQRLASNTCRQAYHHDPQESPGSS